MPSLDRWVSGGTSRQEISHHLSSGLLVTLEELLDSNFPWRVSESLYSVLEGPVEHFNEAILLWMVDRCRVMMDVPTLE